MSATFHLSCPSCGAQATVRSATSVMVVCDYCHSMLLRQPDGKFADNGKAAAVLEDYSLIQIGTSGRYQSRGFTVIGRLQKEYDRGYWNEWYLLFDDGSDGWLSDSGGQYTITQLKEGNRTQAPPFLDTIPGETSFVYGKQVFMAADVRSAKNLGTKAQGELPFALRQDQTTYAADYRFDKYFLTLDYTDCPPVQDAGKGRDRSDEFEYNNAKRSSKDKSPSTEQPPPVQPELYYGQGVSLKDLNCQLLRAADQVQESAGKLPGKAASLECPNCGSPLVWYPGVAHHLVCPSCHADVNISADKAQVLGMHSMRLAQDEAGSIKLGDIAKIGGQAWTVIGFMRCQELEADGSTYLKKSYASAMPFLTVQPMELVQGSFWYEYLLYNPTQGFRWIVETDEGWEMATELSRWPSRGQSGGSIQVSGKSFNKKWEYGSKVIYAAGAFTWHIEPNDITYIADYQGGAGSNQDKLTCERYQNEITWSRSSPVKANDLAIWFRRPELAKIEKKGFEEGGKRSSLTLIAVIFTIGLLLFNFPAMDRLGFDDYFNSMFWGGVLLWLPWHFLTRASTGSSQASDDSSEDSDDSSQDSDDSSDDD